MLATSHHDPPWCAQPCNSPMPQDESASVDAEELPNLYNTLAAACVHAEGHPRRAAHAGPSAALRSIVLHSFAAGLLRRGLTFGTCCRLCATLASDIDTMRELAQFALRSQASLGCHSIAVSSICSVLVQCAASTVQLLPN